MFRNSRRLVLQYYNGDKKSMNSGNVVSYNEEIYRLVEEGWRVLDVGCGTGHLGERLKADKHCFVIGVEIDKDKANQAREKIDGVINSDIELICVDLKRYGSFDAIIFADSLEHLRYPAASLQRLSNYLNSNGYFLISLPNIANWMIRLNLLLGKFDYQDSGILDKTHLHFFTVSSAKKFVQESGFEILYVGSYNRVMKKLGCMWKGLFAHQLIVKAQKSSQMRIES